MTTDAPRPPTTADWIARAAAIAPRTELFVDGRFVPAASGRTFDDIAGRDGSRIAAVAEGGVEDVDRAVAAARRAFDDRRWADQPPAARKRVLLRLSELIREHLEELALLESLDVGKPIRDTLRVDVPSAATTFQWYAETIDKVYGEIGPTGPDALSLVTREPIGVVAAIVPWNYPLIITAWKLGAALATGNSVVLKPASQSPLSALRLAELAAEAGLPDGVLNVVTGPGGVIGDALARHPAVDKIAFTGSTEVGRSLLRAVGETDVKAISLELGGKSPQVVLADVGDLATAATTIGWGIFYNSGQTCNAGSRLVVHRSVREELVGRIAELGQRARARGAARSAHEARLDGRRAPARQGPRLHRSGAGRRGRPGRRWGARPGRERRRLHRPDHPRWRGQLDAGRARGDLRAGPDGHRVRGRGLRGSPSRTTRRTAWRPACGRATSTGRTVSQAGSAPGSCT